MELGGGPRIRWDPINTNVYLSSIVSLFNDLRSKVFHLDTLGSRLASADIELINFARRNLIKRKT